METSHKNSQLCVKSSEHFEIFSSFVIFNYFFCMNLSVLCVRSIAISFVSGFYILNQIFSNIITQ